MRWRPGRLCLRLWISLPGTMENSWVVWGYFLTDIISEPTEMLVLPEYQGQGIGSRLLKLAGENTPTMLYFGAQPGLETFYEKNGCSRSLTSYALNEKWQYKKKLFKLVIIPGIEAFWLFSGNFLLASPGRLGLQSVCGSLTYTHRYFKLKFPGRGWSVRQQSEAGLSDRPFYL